MDVILGACRNSRGDLLVALESLMGGIGSRVVELWHDFRGPPPRAGRSRGHGKVAHPQGRAGVSPCGAEGETARHYCAADRGGTRWVGGRHAPREWARRTGAVRDGCLALVEVRALSGE